MVYSCNWPAYQLFYKINPNYQRIAEYCNLWRNYNDIEDSSSSVYTILEWYASQQAANHPARVQGDPAEQVSDSDQRGPPGCFGQANFDHR